MATDLYSLSDEELLNLNPDDLTSNEAPEQQPEEVTEPVVEESHNDNEQTQSTDEVTEQETVQPDNQSTENDNDIVTNDEQTTEVESQLEVNNDTKSFYETITKPFKANGKEYQITNPNDVIALMQQGINYSKKMEQLKPKQAVIKTLEDNGLLDNEKLGYLIDLYNKKPEAIAKLVKDSEIDLYSFDTEQANEYKPSQVVQPVSMLNEVIEELIQSSPDFLPVLDNMVATIDDKSKQIISDNPHLLHIMNEQRQSGIFDKINHAIEYERMMGRLNGVPYIQAYADMEQRFANANISMQQPVQQQQQGFVAPRPNQTTNNNNNENKRKAVTPTSSANPVNTLPTMEDLHKLSDEELLKLQL